MKPFNLEFIHYLRGVEYPGMRNMIVFLERLPSSREGWESQPLYLTADLQSRHCSLNSVSGFEA